MAIPEPTIDPYLAAELNARHFMQKLRYCITDHRLADMVMKAGVDQAIARGTFCILRPAPHQVEVRARLRSISELPIRWLVHFAVMDFGAFKANAKFSAQDARREFNHLDDAAAESIMKKYSRNAEKTARRMGYFADELLGRKNMEVGNITSHQIANDIKTVLIKRLNHQPFSMAG